MKVYWDTSAIIWYFGHGRIGEIRGITRPHTLSEAFSALTGGGFELVMPDGTRKHRRLSLRAASAVVSKFHPQLEYVDLSALEIVAALQTAQAKSAQGGRVHDLMHAVAAEKAGADELWTIDENDFAGLGKVPLKYLGHSPAA
jgi:predicted nucleic acid-binding protein